MLFDGFPVTCRSVEGGSRDWGFWTVSATDTASQPHSQHPLLQRSLPRALSPLCSIPKVSSTHPRHTQHTTHLGHTEHCQRSSSQTCRANHFQNTHSVCYACVYSTSLPAIYLNVLTPSSSTQSVLCRHCTCHCPQVPTRFQIRSIRAISSISSIHRYIDIRTRSPPNLCCWSLPLITQSLVYPCDFQTNNQTRAHSLHCHPYLAAKGPLLPYCT